MGCVDSSSNLEAVSVTIPAQLFGAIREGCNMQGRKGGHRCLGLEMSRDLPSPFRLVKDGRLPRWSLRSLSDRRDKCAQRTESSYR